VSDPRVSPAPYPFGLLGAKDPKFEIGVHVPVVRRETLARVFSQGSTPSSAVAGLWMSVPDARLIATLELVYEPLKLASLGDISASTIHLAQTVDTKGSPAAAEDLLGTAAAPVAIAGPGLRALSYSPSEEVTGMRADLSLVAPVWSADNAGDGEWVARARWQALYPMTEIEWVKAVGEMVLLVDGGVKTLTVAVPG